MKLLSFFFLFLLWLPGCTSYEARAPVSDIDVRTVGGVLIHRVKAGETIYSIAWRYEMDYRELVKLNHLSSPYTIHSGDDLFLTKPSVNGKEVKVEKAQKKTELLSKRLVKERSTFKGKTALNCALTSPVRRWYWPTRGKVRDGFSKQNKGINISGRYQQPIKAAAAGKVVYAGEGIREYGNLLIIKHNVDYLTAYAYNEELLVREGDCVKAGEKIARMGRTFSGSSLLHFEIRLKGKPVDPIRYIRS